MNLFFQEGTFLRFCGSRPKRKKKERKPMQKKLSIFFIYKFTVIWKWTLIIKRKKNNKNKNLKNKNKIKKLEILFAFSPYVIFIMWKKKKLWYSLWTSVENETEEFFYFFVIIISGIFYSLIFSRSKFIFFIRICLLSSQNFFFFFSNINRELLYFMKFQFYLIKFCKYFWNSAFLGKVLGRPQRCRYWLFEFLNTAFWWCLFQYFGEQTISTLSSKLRSSITAWNSCFCTAVKHYIISAKILTQQSTKSLPCCFV